MFVLFPRVLGAAALVLATLFGTALAPAQEVTVQITAFQVPEIAVGLDTWKQSQSDDAALYERLVRLAGLGEAQVVLDQRLVMRSRRPTSSEARTEYTYPVEFEPMESRFLYLPISFETRNLGVHIEAEATVNQDSANDLSRFIDLGFSAKRVRLKGQLPLRLPALRAGGRVTGTLETPVFLAEEIITLVPMRAGRPLMAGLSRPADPYDEQSGGAAQQVILTFARAATAGDSSPAPGDAAEAGPIPLRLQALTIRAPLVSTAQIMWNHEAAPEENPSMQLLELVRSGTAHIVFHAATTASNQRRARIQAVGEVIYPTESEDIFPKAFETRNVGFDWETEAMVVADGGATIATVNAERTWPPVWRGLALKPGDSPPELPVPEFRVSNWSTSVPLHSGEPGLVAAISPWNDNDASDAATPAWLDVSFVRSSPPSRNPAPPSPTAAPTEPRILASIAVFSVTEETAVSLRKDAPPVKTPAGAAIDPENVMGLIEALWAGTTTDQVRILSFAQVAQIPGHRARLTSGREWMYPSALARTESDPEAFVPTDWETLQPGTRLEMEVYPGDRSDGGTITIDFRCPVADPSFPTTEDLRAALNDKANIPAPTIHELKVAGEFDFTLRQPQLLAIDPSPAPPGHAEHGRWMVTALKVVSGR